jgi:hypothetical protein
LNQVFLKRQCFNNSWMTTQHTVNWRVGMHKGKSTLEHTEEPKGMGGVMNEIHMKQWVSNWLIRHLQQVHEVSDHECHRIHTNQQCSLEHYAFISPQIPCGSSTFYGVNLLLSNSVLQLTTCCMTVLLFLKHCLFRNTWFNLLSSTYYSLCCYLDGL